jgi:hypothetical protein
MQRRTVMKVYIVMVNVGIHCLRLWGKLSIWQDARGHAQLSDCDLE